MPELSTKPKESRKKKMKMAASANIAKSGEEQQTATVGRVEHQLEVGLENSLVPPTGPSSTIAPAFSSATSPIARASTSSMTVTNRDEPPLAMASTSTAAIASLSPKIPPLSTIFSSETEMPRPQPQPHSAYHARLFRNTKANQDAKGWNTLRRTAHESGPSNHNHMVANQQQQVGAVMQSQQEGPWGFTNPFILPGISGQRMSFPRLNPPTQQYDYSVTTDHAWLGDPIHEICPGFIVTSQGFLSIMLHNETRIDITIDQAIRIFDVNKGIILALNAGGTSAAMIHPCGRVYQYGSRVEIATSDPDGNSRLAKMWYKGVSFTAEQCAVVYIVDDAGTRTVTDTFSDTSGDFSLPVFLTNAKQGFPIVAEWGRHIPEMQYWISPERCENWIINGIRLSITREGVVRVTRGPSKYNLRIGLNGAASMTTPYVHTTASVSGTSCHLFAKRGERRMHFDGNVFIVRNGGHSSGIDENSQLKVY